MSDHPPDTIPALAAAREAVREAAAAYHDALAVEAAAMLAEVQRELPGVTLTATDHGGAAPPCVWWRDVWTDGIMFSRAYVPGHGWFWTADHEHDEDIAFQGTAETITEALDCLAEEVPDVVAELRAEVTHG